MSKGTWVKPAARVYAPLRWVSVAVTPRTVGRAAGAGGAFDVFGSGAAVAATWRAGRWRYADPFASSDPAALMRYVEDQAADRKGTWVVSPDATAALTMLGAWVEWDRRKATWAGGQKPPGRSPAATSPRPGVSGRTTPPDAAPNRPESTATDPVIVHTLVARGNPTIVRYTTGGRTLTWVSASQYTAATCADTAARLGIPPPGEADRDAAGFLPDDLSIWTANVWLRHMCELSDWWRAVGGGPWSATAGGLGLSFVRKRIQPKTILSHTDDCARGLEERGLYGGRASVWCVAPVGRGNLPPASLGPSATVRQYPRVPGPVELWDVRSMYPTILEREPFPVRYVGILDAPTPTMLAAAARDYLILADVILDTPVGEYPYRDGERLSFPAGRYRTVLPGPELAAALAAGHVKETIRAVTYRPGRPFTAAAGELVRLRREAEAANDPARAGFVKMLSNAWSGKMAQRKYDWQRAPKVAPLKEWGEWIELDADGVTVRRFRAAAGLVWERIPHKHGGRPLGAVYAFLTSYARDIMRSVRAMLPPRSVVSQDTDGVWVCGDGRAAFSEVARTLSLRGYTITRKLEQPSGRWLGPRHYWTPAGWVLSGFHRPGHGTRSGTWSDTYSRIAPLGTSSRPPIGVETLTRDNLTLTLDVDGAVGPDGWVSPLVIRPPRTPSPSGA